MSLICLTVLSAGPLSVFARSCWVTSREQADLSDPVYVLNWSCDDGSSGRWCSNGAGTPVPASDPPAPPPPPPPVNGDCGTADGQNLFAAPSTNLCAAGDATAVSGSGPWAWSCSGQHGGGDSRACTANLLPPASVSCTVIPSCPDTANVNDPVTWSAIVSGGSGTYTYAWTGDGFVSGKTTATVTGAYTVPGDKTAGVTVSDASGNPITVTCPTTCGGIAGQSGNGNSGNGVVGHSGGGIKVTSNGVCEPSINEQSVSVYPDPAKTSSLCSNGAVSAFQAIQPANAWTDPLKWTWTCLGLNPSLGDSDMGCFATLNSLDDKSQDLNCSVASVPPNISKVVINTNSTWAITPTSTLPVIWKVTDINGNGANYPMQSGNILNNIFTTVGIKIVSAKISSSTLGIYGLPCSATTTVVLSGSIQEQ